MKSNTLYNLFLSLFLLIACTSGCKKDIAGCMDPAAINYNPEATFDTGTCEYQGAVSFWQSGFPSYDITQVTIASNTFLVSLDSPTAPSSCDQTGNARFILAPGTYSYFAEEEGLFGETWSGTVNITINGCLLIQLL